MMMAPLLFRYYIERGPQALTLMIDDDGWVLAVESFVTPRLMHGGMPRKKSIRFVSFRLGFR